MTTNPSPGHRLAGFATSRGRGRGRLITVLACLVLLAAGVVGGYAWGHTTRAASTASTSSSTSRAALPPVNDSTLNTAHGPARFVDGLPVGFNHDQGGALQAAASMGQALIDFVQSRRSVAVSTWVSTYAIGHLDNAAYQQIYDWNPLVMGPPPSTTITSWPALGATPGLGTQSSDIRSVAQVYPLGYRLASYRSTAVHLFVWFNGQGWTQGNAQPEIVIYDSFEFTLRWSGTDWKLTAIAHPSGTAWYGPQPDDPGSGGYTPWPGGQYTVLSG